MGSDLGSQARTQLSQDTWPRGRGSWGFCFGVPVGCFLGDQGPPSQGHWGWNLILIDLPAFPHSSQLGLQSLRERRTRNLAGHRSSKIWTLLKDHSPLLAQAPPRPHPQPHTSPPHSLAEPHAPSGHAHSAWLWLLHLPPWHWPRPPGSCGSDPPAEPAAPEALQPVDTSVQGLAPPGPARPLLLPPCKEAAPENEALGFKEKVEPKSLKVGGTHSLQRPEAMSEANTDNLW